MPHDKRSLRRGISWLTRAQTFEYSEVFGVIAGALRGLPLALSLLSKGKRRGGIAHPVFWSVVYCRILNRVAEPYIHTICD
jgi:hypothetical protein